ncbi:MAG: hypothetical protein ACYDB7_05965 [Mycobacteriales bacterium]
MATQPARTEGTVAVQLLFLGNFELGGGETREFGPFTIKMFIEDACTISATPFSAPNQAGVALTHVAVRRASTQVNSDGTVDMEYVVTVAETADEVLEFNLFAVRTSAHLAGGV